MKLWLARLLMSSLFVFGTTTAAFAEKAATEQKGNENKGSGETSKSDNPNKSDKADKPEKADQPQETSPWEKAFGSAHSLSNEGGDAALAERKYLQSIKLEKASAKPNWRKLTMSMNNLADLYLRHGKLDKAEAFRKQSLAIVDKEAGRKSIEAALLLNSLAAVSIHKKDWTGAEKYSIEAAEIADQVLSGKHPQLRNFYTNLAYIHERTGNTARAQAMYEKSLANEGEVEASDIPMALALSRLAAIYEKSGKLDEALSLYKRSSFSLAVNYFEDDPSLPRCQHAMGDIYFKQGKYKEAEAEYYNAVLSYCKTRGNTKAEVEKALDDCLSAFKRSNKKDRIDYVLNIKKRLIADFDAKPADKAPERGIKRRDKKAAADQP